MTNYRMLFKKEGRAVYISHLDLMRTVQRAFARAGLKIKHTEGFNPHPHMVFAVPLSLGVSSQCELVDFALTEDVPAHEVTRRLAPQMPEGVVPVRTWLPRTKLRELYWLEAEAQLIYEGDRDIHSLCDEVSALFTRSELLIEKKTKRGMGTVDILPQIKEIDFETEDHGLHMHCVVKAQDPGLNPNLIVKAIETHLPHCAPALVRMKRLGVMQEDGTLFE